MVAGAALPVLNHLLDQAPGAHARLQRHAGATARLQLGGVGLSFSIAEDGRLLADDSETPAVTLRLPADALLKAMHDGDAVLRDARIEGDAALAETLGQVLRGLRWDAAEDLSRLVGDVAAERLVAGARGALSAGRDLGDRLLTSTGEYVADEANIVMRRAAITDFSNEVDVLRDDSARLQKRLEALERQRLS
ncbi:hypothetical protein METUNv1_03375 [Methyloversatilis universalis FAM5]|uniref:Ubiquinone biosynthesis accessory factor UbiJ n=1 Tax=Methyloversatilis universalis (strain ATCC BAA-1314 / DSM 25237 / JCM 13912 / CCUG 52030 / FAM5) TaxID=1000565 RepID=F5RFY2_METUF|nr:SCP2 sterol-binding domain-containing protein [Methyloversatilis universalis]EGK70470.1 hypothetical protein METUNv1_03375 [Methyloversatilis universalis FAM5]